MYFDKNKRKSLEQTPLKDGHIFTKQIIGEKSIYEFQVWDFLNKSELGEDKNQSSEFERYEQNKK